MVRLERVKPGYFETALVKTKVLLPQLLQVVEIDLEILQKGNFINSVSQRCQLSEVLAFRAFSHSLTGFPTSCPDKQSPLL